MLGLDILKNEYLTFNRMRICGYKSSDILRLLEKVLDFSISEDYIKDYVEDCKRHVKSYTFLFEEHI